MCFEQGEAHTRMLLGTLAPSHNCQETKINTVLLNSGNEMSALPNTGLVAYPERCSLSARLIIQSPQDQIESEDAASPGKHVPCLLLSPVPLAPPIQAGAGFVSPY